MLQNSRSASVKELLLEKYPKAQTPPPEVLLSGQPSSVHPVFFFYSLSAELLKKVALHSRGSAGPSGLNSSCWRQMYSSFKGASSNLCHALTGLAQLLATKVVDPVGIAPFLASRLVTLDKQAGERPIGVGEVLRRIVAKAILAITKNDIENACGFLQKCSGMPAGIEAAVHAMQEIYEQDSTEGVLLIDASNAFNCLNRSAALHNTTFLCPSRHYPYKLLLIPCVLACGWPR